MHLRPLSLVWLVLDAASEVGKTGGSWWIALLQRWSLSTFLFEVLLEVAAAAAAALVLFEGDAGKVLACGVLIELDAVH